ncbi:hypothetical protein PILCRDRAFT_828678, partial [Piloderma croceum F 1598]
MSSTRGVPSLAGTHSGLDNLAGTTDFGDLVIYADTISSRREQVVQPTQRLTLDLDVLIQVAALYLFCQITVRCSINRQNLKKILCGFVIYSRFHISGKLPD